MPKEGDLAYCPKCDMNVEVVYFETEKQTWECPAEGDLGCPECGTLWDDLWDPEEEDDE